MSVTSKLSVTAQGLATFADYAAGDAHNEIALTAESALLPKKPPAPSSKRRLKRGRKAKLLK